MTTRYFHRFSYFTAQKRDRDLLLHQLRDGDAALELSDVLFSEGYRYGGLILNYPTEGKLDRRALDDTFLKPRDLVLLTTRPPLDDTVDQPRKRLDRSYTTLEEKIFAALRQYFQHCSRSQVIISEGVARQLPGTFNKRNIQFKQNLSPVYDACDGRKYSGRPPLTAVYLVSIPEAWTGGPGLLCVFGMGGKETLGWTHLLRTRYNGLVPRLLKSGGMIMAEIEQQEIRVPPDSLSFSQDWKMEILIDIRHDELAGLL